MGVSETGIYGRQVLVVGVAGWQWRVQGGWHDVLRG